MKETIKIKYSKNAYIYKILLILLCILAPMLILFLFGGEINLNKENWLVATWGKKWGLLIDNTYGFGVNIESAIVSWQPFVYSLVIIIATSIIFFILAALKKIDLLFYTIIFSSWFVLFIILISGLLYPSPNGDEVWKIIVRIILIAISFVVIFFPLNWLLNTIIVHSKNSENHIKSIIDKEIEAKDYIDKNIEFKSPKNKTKKKITSIDVKE